MRNGDMGGGGEEQQRSCEASVDGANPKIDVIDKSIDLAAVSSLPGPEVKSLFILSVENPIRATCIQIYTHAKFAEVILVVILLNSILMLVTYTAPCDQKHPCLQEVAKWIDLIFTVCFAFEMIVKVVALGFILHTQSYLRNGWNVLDFITVVASIVSLTGAGSNVSVLRLLRILRPLRTMSKVAGLRNLMGALFAAVPEIRDNVILIIFLVIIFAILGVQLFGGAFRKRCYVTDMNNDNLSPSLLATSSSLCGGSYSCPSDPNNMSVACMTLHPPRDPLSFDDLGVAMLLVFKVFSGDDWPEDMINVMNAVSSQAWIYFFMCIMVGGLFATNLFLAVLINAYYTNAKRAEDTNEDTQERAKAAWFRLLPHPEREARAGSVVSGLQVMAKSMPASAFNAERRSSVTESSESDDTKKVYMKIPKPAAAFQNNKCDSGNEVVRKNKIPVVGFVGEEPRDNTESAVTVGPEESDADESEPLPDSASMLDKSRAHVKGFVLNIYVERFVLIVTAINVLALAIDHHNINKTLLYVLEIVGIICLTIFATEITLKIFALGPITCLKDKYNAFDAFLVAISLPDLATGGSSAFSAFRAFRMMRALRFIKRWPSVHNLLKALVGCLNEGMYVALLLLLQIFIFSILGMQLFEDRYPEDYRANFNSMWEASLTCFVVITGDAWANVMKEGIIATNGVAAVYFLLLFLVGNYVLVNVVVAVILDKLDDNIGSDEPEDDAPWLDEESEGGRAEAVAAAESQLAITEQSSVISPNPGAKKSLFNDEDEEPTSLLACLCKINDLTITGNSLGCLGPENPLRAALAKMVFSNIFDFFIAGAIAVNIVFLSMESPNNSDKLQHILDITNYVFTSLFFMEMVVKIIVLGLWLPRPPYEPDQAAPYLRDPWNRVDVVVVLLAVVGLVYKPMSAFRSLRTLRLVIRSAQLRLVIAAMLSTLPSITQGLVVCGFIWFVFGILGTQLFKGTFYYCTDSDVEYQTDCNGTYNLTDPGATNGSIFVERAWKRENDHFDNVFSSMYTLFAVAVGEGWASIMYRGVDATKPGRGPVKNHNPLAALFFVVFHVVGNFFCVNLIVGILINNFTENRKRMSANDSLSERQRKYVETEVIVGSKLVSFREPPPEGYVRKMVFITATHCYFEHCVTTVIIVNMVILATIHHGQSDDWSRSQDIGNYFCTSFFTVEALVKIVGFGPVAYSKENWNRFDFIIVTLSLVGLLLPDAGGISAVRVLRVGRLFRLVHAAKGLQKLFNTMFEGENLAYFANVGVLCVACFFMFGVAGVNMFGSLERTNGLDHNLNFETVPNAMLTLFAISTTEGWLDVRNGLTNVDDCGNEGQGSCGSRYATIYMLSFMIVGSFMMLNLFAAVVVELFEAQEAQEKRAQEVAALMELKERWERIFGNKTLVPCSSFVTALFLGDLFPARLKRVPQLPRPEDEMESLNIACITLGTKPSVEIMLAYLIALSLPIVINDGAAMLSYFDLVQCCMAKVFLIQSIDLKHLSERGLLPKGYPRSSRRLGHWFAGMLWSKRDWVDHETRRIILSLEEDTQT